MLKQRKKEKNGKETVSFFTKTDVSFLCIFFLIGVAITAGIYIPKTVGADSYPDDAVQLEVCREGEVLMTLSLLENTRQRVDCDGGYNVFSVSEGKVVMEEADCHDGICMRSGAIGNTQDTIVCLPHRLVLKIVKTDVKTDDSPDAIAR